MSRRRSAANSVSLFPFLAVLVCAMGALILLLIVTTRRVRSDALAKAKAAATPSAPAAKTEIKPPAATPGPPARKPPAIAVATARPERRPPPAAVRMPNAARHSKAVAQREDPNPALQRVLARLQAERSRHVKQFGDANRRFQSVERDASLLMRAARDAAEKQRTMKQRVVSLKTDAEKSEQVMANTTAEIDALRRQIQRQRDDFARASSAYAIVPFDGDTGTTRRPIFIECTGKAFRFLPENITLTPADIRGFTSAFNPLLTGTRQLVKYWSDKHRAAGDEPKPYVLLLVRPSGATSFYVARRLLKNLGQPIGYELIDERLQLALPEVDPKAQVVCQVGVRRAFSERSKLIKELAGADPGPGPGGRSMRFNRGTGRIEVIDPARQRAGANGTGSGAASRTARSGDPWSRAVSGRLSPGATSPTYPGNGNGTGGASAFGNRGSRTGNGGGGPRRFAGTSGSGLGRRGSGSGRLGAGRPGGNPSEKTTGIAGNRGTAPGNLQSAGDGWNATGREGVAGSRAAKKGSGLPGSPNGIDDGGAAGPVAGGTDGSPNGPAGNRVAGKSAGRGATQYGGATEGGTAAAPGQQSSGAGTGSPGAGGQSGNSSPSPSTSMTIGRLRGSRRLRQAKKRWGFSNPGATIGFEREVTVQTTADRLIVGRRYVIRIGKGEPTRQLMLKLTAAVESEARSWGKPPNSFYWVPMLRFVISPGGNQHYQRLRSEVHKIGLQSAVEYKLETPADPARKQE